MAENFERVLKKEWYREDLKALTSEIKEQESLLRLKRGWLMDLPLSMSQRKRVEEMFPLSDKILPDSLLREDDVSYEDIRTCIETGFGVHNYGKEPHFIREDVKLFNPRDDFRDILFLLDDMTNKGLYTFLKILTDGTVKFEKTNWSMKRTTRELLRKIIADKSGISKTKIKQLSQLLEDPKNVCGNHMMTSITRGDIAKAIHLVNDTKKVSVVELKRVLLLSDPNSKVPVRSLRSEVRKLLTGFLNECSDIEDIPDYLVETLEIINRRTHKRYSSSKSRLSPEELTKEVIQKEVECVLAISSEAKEVVMDSLPEHEFDEEFAHAYMEDFEGSDISDGDVEDNSPSYDSSHNSHGKTESIGETNPVEASSHLLSPSGGSDEISAFPDSPSLSHSPARNSRISGNQYIDVQEACDVTSVIAYRFVGHALDKLAKMDNLVLHQSDRLYLRHYSSASEDSANIFSGESPQTLSTSEFMGIWKNVLES